MTKLVGIMLIVISTSVCGFECAKMLSHRMRSLKAFIRLLDALALRISSFSTPINEFFCSYKDDELEKSGLISGIRSGMSFCAAVSQCKEALFLDESDMGLLLEFGEGLGMMSAQEEARRCMYYKSEFEKHLASAADELPLKIRLLKSSGVMCGILAAVILL